MAVVVIGGVRTLADAGGRASPQDRDGVRRGVPPRSRVVPVHTAVTLVHYALLCVVATRVPVGGGGMSL